MKQRVFLSLWPPPAVVGQLAAALPAAHPDVRWQPSDRWHITVAFLGDRSPDKELRRLHSLVLAPAESVRLQGSGTFGPVLWVGVSTGPWLPQLARQTVEAFGVNDRRFRAHLTVARARSAPGRRQLNTAREELAGFRSDAWTPTELTLVSSRTGPSPSYEVIGRKPFPGP